jgi:hypothetical protein
MIAKRPGSLVLTLAILVFATGCNDDRPASEGPRPEKEEPIKLTIKFKGIDAEMCTLRLQLVFENRSKSAVKMYPVAYNSMGVLQVEWYDATDGRKLAMGEEVSGKDSSDETLVIEPGRKYVYETTGWENRVFFTGEEAPDHEYRVRALYHYALFQAEGHSLISNFISIKVPEKTMKEVQQTLRKRGWVRLIR